jgi:hypothetical protein
LTACGTTCRKAASRANAGGSRTDGVFLADFTEALYGTHDLVIGCAKARVFGAMMTVTKFDIAELERAAQAED